ncbi:MAG: nuclear transport factor 2 family protein [Bacteroidales bacterium]|nr:nuclear transport factor 2 family protein [Bacteroidales bacterium]
MKNYLWTSLIALVFLAGTSCQEKIDIEKEKEAVIAVNEEERDAYFDRDLARLEAIWIQEPTSQRVFTSRNALSVLDGWKQIHANYEEDINNTDRWENYEDLSAPFSNYDVKIHDNTALLYHDIHWTGKSGGEVIDVKQKRIVHFVKEDGAWKFDLTVQLTVPAEKEVVEDTPESDNIE